MTVLERLVRRLFARPIDESVRRTVDARIEELALEARPEAALYRYLVHGDASRLHIQPTAVVNNALFNVSSGEITVGAYAFFGHNVSVLTGTHDVNKFGQERQQTIPRSGRDVVVEDGAWLASDVLVLGPCVIGRHSVVAAGSLVSRDVEPYTIVAGRPARPLRKIKHDG